MQQKQKPFFWDNWKYNAFWALGWFLLLLFTSTNLIYWLTSGLRGKIPLVLFTGVLYFSVILILLDALAVVLFTLRAIINYQQQR